MRRCFVLGAGFSKACGLPLAGELSPVVWRAMARRLPLDVSDNAPTCQPGDPEYDGLEVHRGAIRSLFPDCDCNVDIPESWPDFEELITALDESSRYQQSFERITGTHVEDVPANTKRLLMLSLEERLSELTHRAVDRGLGPVARFVDSLNLDSDCVISFNWDVLIEIAAHDASIPTFYHYVDTPGLLLAKPHGSVNLVDSPASVYIEMQQRVVNVRDLDEEYEYDLAGTKHVVLRARDPRQAWIRQAWAPREFMLLVEPNIRKTYDRYWLEGQWVRALNMVRHADEIIVIGFSLPFADLRPRILFQLARLNRNSPPAMRIVDPNATALCGHYRKLTGLSPQPFVGTLTDFLST